MTLQQAFLAWQRLFPAEIAQSRAHVHSKDKLTLMIPASWNGKCCNEEHYLLEGGPRIYDKVCPREKAWRMYITIRDGIDPCVHL